MLNPYEYTKQLDELVTEITIVSGYSLEELRNKFLAGWTLTPPKDLINLRDVMKMNKLENLPQYHFERDDFCKMFKEVFTIEQIYYIEEECVSGKHTENFSLFRVDDDFYILHRDSGVLINYYKHLGRINTCSVSDFTLDDLRYFLKSLKEELFN